MSQKPPRKHHFVPRFLLANFTNKDGVLWTYDTEKQKCWQSRPDSTGFENNLYAIEPNAELPDVAAVEKALADTIDGPGAKAIGGLLRGEELSGERWACFLGFVAAQMQRTPSAFGRLASWLAPSMQEMLERMAKYDGEFRAHVANGMERAGATPAEIAEELRAVGDGTYQIQPHRELVLKHSLKLIAAMHAELEGMQWGILSVPDGEPDLIIGDHPVILSDQGPACEPPRAIGIRNPNIELLIVLSKRMVAKARWTGESSYGEIGVGAADIVNERTLRHARRFIFAPYASDALLERAIALNGSGPRVYTRKVRTRSGLAIIKELR